MTQQLQAIQVHPTTQQSGNPSDGGPEISQASTSATGTSSHLLSWSLLKVDSFARCMPAFKLRQFTISSHTHGAHITRRYECRCSDVHILHGDGYPSTVATVWQPSHQGASAARCNKGT